MSDAKPEGIRPKDTGSGMTPSQRYLFDLTGFLHIRGVRGAELEAAQAAIEKLIATPRHEREAAGFTHQADGNYPPEEPIVRYEHAYAFDRVLERIAMHQPDIGEPLFLDLREALRHAVHVRLGPDQAVIGQQVRAIGEMLAAAEADLEMQGA